MKLKYEINYIILLYLIVILLIEAKKVAKIPKSTIFPIPVKLRRIKIDKIFKKTLDISKNFIIFMIIIMLFKNNCTIILKIKLLIFDKDCKIKIKYKAISLILLFLAFSLLGVEEKDFSISRRSNSPIKEVRGAEEKGKNSINDINYYSGSIQLYFSFSPTELKFYKTTDQLDINEVEYDKVSLIVR